MASEEVCGRHFPRNRFDRTVTPPSATGGWDPENQAAIPATALSVKIPASTDSQTPREV